jgi:hypothetical protein
LVAQIAARSDKRRVELALTDAGRAVLRRSPEPVQHRLIAAIAALGDHQRRFLADALGDVARLMDGRRASGHPPMLFEDERPARRRRGRRTTRRGGPR